jgi:hypothetical protein
MTNPWEPPNICPIPRIIPVRRPKSRVVFREFVIRPVSFSTFGSRRVKKV